MNIHLYFLQRILNFGFFQNNLKIEELLQNSTKNYICLDPKPPIVNILTFAFIVFSIYICIYVCMSLYTHRCIRTLFSEPFESNLQT